MLAIPQPCIEKRQRATQHHTDIEVSFAPNQVVPVAYLTGVGQLVKADCSALNSTIEITNAQEFLLNASTLLCEIEQHFGNDLAKSYLSLSPSAMLEQRQHVLNTILRNVSDITHITDIDPKLFENIHKHMSLFSLTVGKTRDCYEIQIKADEPFFMYNVTERDYPEFIRGWLEAYIEFLANKMGIETMSQSFVQYELGFFLDMLEVTETYNDEQIDMFKKCQQNKLLTKAEQAFMDAVKDSIAEYTYYEETFKRVVDAVIELDEINKVGVKPVSSFATLKDEFNTLCSWFAKSLCDSESKVSKVINVLQRQLTVLESINIQEALPNDLIETGDMPLGSCAILDTERKLWSTAVDMHEIGENRMSSDECAELTLELASSTARQSLNRFIVCEYFAYQLCNIHHCIKPEKG